jgi:hypothetical protein
VVVVNFGNEGEVVMADPSSECTVECVAERGGPVTLLCVDADGVRPWLEVAVRAVPAYQRATLAVCAAVVGVLGLVVRPIVAGWPWWLHAGLGVLVTVGVWLLIGLVADLVFSRLVESLVTDTAQAVLGAAAPMPLAFSGDAPTVIETEGGSGQ